VLQYTSSHRLGPTVNYGFVVAFNLMATSTGIETTENALRWLGQFSLGDRVLATELLQELLLVSRSEFADGLRTLVLEKVGEIAGPVALYAERELRHRHGVPHRLFRESNRKRKRAEGVVGPPAVKATQPYNISVGSEGIVAQLISELARAHPKKILDHPGPEQIRRMKVREFWVVTDIVGSGHRVWNYLQAAWLVRSVRSWWSGGFLRFGVVAYAGTEVGMRYVVGHASKPKYMVVKPAPTIRTVFSVGKAQQMERLCEAYVPSAIADGKTHPLGWGGPAHNPLGYGGAGALLVFAHGAPNNIPPIFHKASRSAVYPWVPLFPARVSASIGSEAFGLSLTPEKIKTRLEKLGQHRLARSAVVNSDLPTWEVFSILTALSKPPRSNDSVLARRSGLETTRVRRLCRLLREYGWIDSQRRLTDAGEGQLKHARKKQEMDLEKIPISLQPVNHVPYYPKSLRHPV
jgi:hypothetical protein